MKEMNTVLSSAQQDQVDSSVHILSNNIPEEIKEILARRLQKSLEKNERYFPSRSQFDDIPVFYLLKDSEIGDVISSKGSTYAYFFILYLCSSTFNAVTQSIEWSSESIKEIFNVFSHIALDAYALYWTDTICSVSGLRVKEGFPFWKTPDKILLRSNISASFIKKIAQSEPETLLNAIVEFFQISEELVQLTSPSDWDASPIKEIFHIIASLWKSYCTDFLSVPAEHEVLSKFSSLFINSEKYEKFEIDETFNSVLPQEIIIYDGDKKKGTLSNKQFVLGATQTMFASSKNVNFNGLDLYGIDLRQVRLVATTLTTTNLTDAELTQIDLTDADLSDSNLTRATLVDAILIRTCLKQTNLTLANLEKVMLAKANLTKAILIETNLANANLKSAILEDADLSGATLTGTNFTAANLSRAILTKADLRDAIWFCRKF